MVPEPVYYFDRQRKGVSVKIIKRDGREVPFDRRKIVAVIQAANRDVPEDAVPEERIRTIAETIESKYLPAGRAVHVEEIQDQVMDALAKDGHYKLLRHYSEYRLQHDRMRHQNTTDGKILSLIERNNEEAKQENANKNPVINSTQRDYIAGEVSRDITRRILLPEEVVKAHDEGILHFHDSDYFIQHSHNCCLLNLEDMLQNGTVISGTMIEKPHSFYTACNVTTQIVAQVASNQYGGQSFSLAHLAPFVDISRQKIRKEIEEDIADPLGGWFTEEEVDELTEKRLRREIKSGVQTIQYQIITLMTCNGQAPFVTVFMYLNEVPEGRLRDDLAMVIEEVLQQRIKGVKNETGVWITPAFPKLIYVLDENNAYPGSEYFYLTELAAECTAKRMVPDYISAKVMKELKGDVYTCMGCRSFLTPDTVGMGPDGSKKYYGRFNQGVVTLNLVDVACSAEGDEDKFWGLMEERTELCKKALLCRHERLKGTPSDVAPILWQHGALARLQKGEVIDRLLYDNYSTISLGYAGLSECTWRMKGCSHTDPEGKEFALSVMRFLNEKCAAWRKETNISFSLYGTPMESTTYKFAKCLQRRFGIIPHVTDKNYITNSYHVHVTEKIDAFTKLSFEAEFQALSPGGAISYVEVPNMQDNIPAVLSIMQHIYDTILYAELNTKSDYCQVCGYDGEIQIVKEDGKLLWECPVCKNRDERKMNVARRVCGYLGSNFFNQGRTAEIADRVMHTSVSLMEE